MGQKVHPEAMRVGYIHDWRSHWFSERNFAEYLARGHPRAQAHRRQALPCRALGHHDQEERCRARGQHPHRASGDRDRQVRGRSGRAAARPSPHDQEADQGQHPRDQAPGARRQAGRAVDRRTAPEPRGLPPRHEARAHERHALGREGREGAGLRTPRRRRDGAHGKLLGRPRAAAHDARGHRLRLPRGPHHVRPHRREVLDEQGRNHARGLHRQRPHGRQRTPASARARPRGCGRRPVVALTPPATESPAAPAANGESAGASGGSAALAGRGGAEGETNAAAENGQARGAR